MSTNFFSISSEATRWILELLRGIERESESTVMVPVLRAFIAEQILGVNGHVVYQFNGLRFDIAWDSIDSPLLQTCAEITICGERVLVQSDALELLKGKELIVETVNENDLSITAVSRMILVCR